MDASARNPGVSSPESAAAGAESPAVGAVSAAGSSESSGSLDSAAHLAADWGPAGRAALRKKVLDEMPGWYSPLGHFVFPACVGVGVIVACALALRDLRSLELLTIPITFLVSNAIEWHAHRDVLHKRSGMLPILYERHTPVHHKLFAMEDMAITDWRELRNVLLPSFGVFAILCMQLPLLALAFLVGLRNVALLFMATSMGYVLFYEWMHLAYHLPATSFIGRRPLIRWLRQHHARHHDPRLMQKWNMNVTLPLWDWLRGTIYREAACKDVGRREGARSGGEYARATNEVADYRRRGAGAPIR